MPKTHKKYKGKRKIKPGTRSKIKGHRQGKKKTFKVKRGEQLFSYKNLRNRSGNNLSNANSNIFINHLERLETWYDGLNPNNKKIYDLNKFKIERFSKRLELFDFDFDRLSPERKEDFKVFMDASSIKSPIRLIDSYFSHQDKTQAIQRLTHKSLIESEIMKRSLMSTPQKDTNLSLIKNPDIPKYILAFHGGLVIENKLGKPEFVGIAEVPKNTTITFLTSIDRLLYRNYEYHYNLLKSLTPKVMENLFRYGTKPDKGEECFKYSVQYLPGDRYPDIMLSISTEYHTHKGSNPYFDGSAVDMEDCRVNNLVLEGIYYHSPRKGFEKMPFDLPKRPDGLLYNTSIMGKKRMKLSDTIEEMTRQIGKAGHFIVNCCRSCSSSKYYNKPEFKHMTTAIKSYELFKRLVSSNLDFFVNFKGKNPCLLQGNFESPHNHRPNNNQVRGINKMVNLKRENSQELGISPYQNTVSLGRNINTHTKIQSAEYLSIIKEFVDAIIYHQPDIIDELLSWESGYKYTKKKISKFFKDELIRIDSFNFINLNRVYISFLDHYLSHDIDNAYRDNQRNLLLKKMIPNIFNLAICKFLFDSESKTDILDKLLERIPIVDLFDNTKFYANIEVSTLYTLISHGGDILNDLPLKSRAIDIKEKKYINVYFKNLKTLIVKILNIMESKHEYLSQNHITVENYFIKNKDFVNIFDLLVNILSIPESSYNVHTYKLYFIFNKLADFIKTFVPGLELGMLLNSENYYELKHVVSKINLKNKLKFNQNFLLATNKNNGDMDMDTKEIIKYASFYLYYILYIKKDKKLSKYETDSKFKSETGKLIKYFKDGTSEYDGKNGFLEMFVPISIDKLNQILKIYYMTDIGIDNFKEKNLEPTLFSVMIYKIPFILNINDPWNDTDILKNIDKFLRDDEGDIYNSDYSIFTDLFYQVNKKPKTKYYIFFLIELIITNKYKMNEYNYQYEYQYEYQEKLDLLISVLRKLLNIYYNDIVLNKRNEFLDIMTAKNKSLELKMLMGTYAEMTPLDLILFYYEYYDIGDIKTHAPEFNSLINLMVTMFNFFKTKEYGAKFDGDYTRFYNPNYKRFFQKLI